MEIDFLETHLLIWITFDLLLSSLKFFFQKKLPKSDIFSFKLYSGRMVRRFQAEKLKSRVRVRKKINLSGKRYRSKEHISEPKKK